MRFLLAWSVALLATVCAYAQPNIKAGEYFVGTFDPGPGSGTAFSVADGAWNEAIEAIISQVQTLTPGSSPTLINIRLKDTSDNWGPLFKKVVFYQQVQTQTRSVNVSAAEFYFGNFDPGEGSGIAMPVFDNNFDEAVETVLRSSYVVSLGSSPILFNVRMRDADGNWGPVFKKTIFNEAAQTATRAVNLSQGEFYFGNFDPGAGNGIAILALDGNYNEAVENVLRSAYTATLGSSPILFNIRVKDADGNWGPVFKKTIFNEAAQTATRSVNLSQGEFYFGNFDPGAGNGIAILALDGNYNEAVESVLRSAYTATLGSSPILFNIRVKDADGNWGPVFKKTIFNEAAQTNTRSVDITQAEYFFGNFDPGARTCTPIIAFDGALNEAVETVLRTSATWTVTADSVLFNIRLRDGAGLWGPLFKKVVFPQGINATVNLIAQGNSTSTCPGTPVTLNYSGPNGFSTTWFNGATTSSITFTPANQGYYGITATNGIETYTDSILVSYLSAPAPVITPSGTILACPSSNITLTTQTVAGNTYQWLLNNTAITAATNTSYLPTAFASYSVRVTNTATTCVTVSAPVVISNTATITSTASAGNCSLPITLDAQAGTGNAYQWFLNGVAINGATASTYSANQVGSYTVRVTNGACISTSTAVNVSSSLTAPTITASGPTTFCQGGSVTLTSSATSGNTWSTGATTQSIVVTAGGSYTVTLTDGGGCSATSPATVVTVNETNTAGNPSANPTVCINSALLRLQPRVQPALEQR